jgi:hypothetical protein
LFFASFVFGLRDLIFKMSHVLDDGRMTKQCFLLIATNGGEKMKKQGGGVVEFVAVQSAKI